MRTLQGREEEAGSQLGLRTLCQHNNRLLICTSIMRGSLRLCACAVIRRRHVAFCRATRAARVKARREREGNQCPAALALVSVYIETLLQIMASRVL